MHFAKSVLEKKVHRFVSRNGELGASVLKALKESDVLLYQLNGELSSDSYLPEAKRFMEEYRRLRREGWFDGSIVAKELLRRSFSIRKIAHSVIPEEILESIAKRVEIYL